MLLSAIILARVLAYVETVDLNPQGSIFYPELVQELVDRYRFQKFPKSLEQFDQSKGVEFLEGSIGGKVIQKFVIWDKLLVLETRSSTADSMKILEELLLWGVKRFRLNYRPEMINHFAYISDLTFYSDAPLLVANPAVSNLAQRTSELISGIWQEPIQYESLNISVGHDPAARKYGIAPFTIQRRADARFSDNKYFSEAPLPTDLHLELLEQYERDIIAAIKIDKF